MVSAATVPYIALLYVFDSPQYYRRGLIQIVLLIADYTSFLFGLGGSACQGRSQLNY